MSAIKPSQDLDEIGPEQRLFAPKRLEVSQERRLLARVLLLATLVVLMGGAVNVIVDPLYRWRTGLLAPFEGEDGIKGYALDHRVPVETVVIGNSRALAIDPEHMSKATRWRSFNAAASLSSWKDQIHTADTAIRRSPQRVRHVVWVLTPESMSRQPREGASKLLDDLHDTFSLGELKATAKSVAPRLGISYHPNLLYTYDEGTGRQTRVRTVVGWFDRGDAEARRRVRAFLEPGLITSWASSVADASIRADVEKAISGWSRRGISTVIVIPPYQPLVYHLGGNEFNDMAAELGIWAATLETRGVASVVDVSHIESFSGAPNEFLDGVHLRGANVRKLTDSVVRALRAL